MTRIVFFGTPEEAVPALRQLHGRFGVALVVTQPDRPRGRSGRPMPPPVKEFALEAGIPVVQPTSGTEIADSVDDGYDLGVVVAYGRILRPEVLDAFRYGILNIHFSLLPRWRGAAPVSRALMAGDTMTGVTIIRLDEGLDTGPVLTAQVVDIHPSEDAGALTTRLAEMGAHLLTSVVPGYLAGEVVPVEQTDDGVTYAAKLESGDRVLDGTTEVDVFLGRIRGLAPSPGATLTIDGDVHKILAAHAGGTPPGPGRWELDDGRPVVNVGGVGVIIDLLQPPGKRPMDGDEWVRGRRRSDGNVGSRGTEYGVRGT